MTSKEALQQIMTIYGETNSLEGTYNLFKKIKKDLERLQELEVANRNNEKVVEDCNKLINRNLELQQENKELLISNSLLRKTLDIIIGCISNATDLSQVKDDIIYKVTKEVLGDD